MLTGLKAFAVLSICLGILGAPCIGQQSPSLRVTVVDKEGAAIKGAEVRIAGVDRLGIPAPNGTISFKTVVPGS